MTILVWLLVGTLVGSANALSMVLTVQRLTPSARTRGLHWTMAGVFMRWALTAALLWLAFRSGIWPGLMALAGFWLVRWGAILWWNHVKSCREGSATWRT